jgi:hypothetical protein
MWWKRRGAGGLRRVLLEEWDPIGVRDYPGAVDEYDSYLGSIAERLRSGESEEELAGYLNHVTYVRIGLSVDPELNVSAARRIVEWYANEMGATGS